MLKRNKYVYTIRHTGIIINVNNFELKKSYFSFAFKIRN